MKQIDVADALEVSSSYISQMEKNSELPTTETLKRLSEILDIPIQIWLYPHDEPEALDLAVNLLLDQNKADSKVGSTKSQDEQLKDYQDYLEKKYKRDLMILEKENEILKKQLELERLKNEIE